MQYVCCCCVVAMYCICICIVYTNFIHTQADQAVINVDTRARLEHFCDVLVVNEQVNSRAAVHELLISCQTNARAFLQFNH